MVSTSRLSPADTITTAPSNSKKTLMEIQIWGKRHLSNLKGAWHTSIKEVISVTFPKCLINVCLLHLVLSLPMVFEPQITLSQ